MSQKITLYHGSQQIVRRLVFGEGNPYNDYGLGFYCTKEIELTKEWACGEEQSGFANQNDTKISTKDRPSHS